MFPTCENSQKRVKNQKSTDKHSSFDGLIQEDIDLSDIYLTVLFKITKFFTTKKVQLNFVNMKSTGKFHR